MCKNQYFQLTLIIVLLLTDVYSWNYYRSYRQIDGPKACTFVKCKDDELCVNRKFGCRYSPCPNMIYCAKTQTESLRGPSSCDTVQCSKGHICIVKVRHCKWDEPCGEEVARCITEMEYHNGPASCAGFKCSAGHACILRETFCPRPPCKLLRSCVSKKDHHIWLGKCKTLGCLSLHECFLRRPVNVCESKPCKHTPDCIAQTLTQLTAIQDKCRGWICPRNQVCEAEVEEPCENFDCKIFRTCHHQLANYDDQENNQNYLKNSTQPLAHLRTELPHIIDDNEDNVKYVSTSTEKSFLSDVNPTLSSLSLLMDYLQNETGVDAVKNWVQKAEEANDYTGFRQWLQSVKELLGIKSYSHWLDEIRDITASSKAFQQWLAASNISTLANINQSNTSQDKNNNESQIAMSHWISHGNESSKDIYNTHSMMNPWYHQQNRGLPPLNAPRIFPYLFEPGNRREGSLTQHYGYYILPPVHYPSVGHENLHQSTTESNQQDLFRQFTDNSNDVETKKRASLVELLQKLKEERLLYQEVINKTQELVAKVRPLLPPSYLDEIVYKLQNNKSQMNEFDWSLLGTQRILTGEPKNIGNQETLTSVPEVIENSGGGGNGSVGNVGAGTASDYSTEDDTEFFLVDYNEASALDINQTLPRVFIKVENNLDSSMRIGEIGVKYDDHISLTNTSYHQQSLNKKNNNGDEDYYNGDHHYNSKVPINTTSIITTTLNSSKDLKKT